MSEREFWSSTPREMMALIAVHDQINNPDSKKKQPVAYIDQVM